MIWLRRIAAAPLLLLALICTIGAVRILIHDLPDDTPVASGVFTAVIAPPRASARTFCCVRISYCFGNSRSPRFAIGCMRIRSDRPQHLRNRGDPHARSPAVSTRSRFPRGLCLLRLVHVGHRAAAALVGVCAARPARVLPPRPRVGRDIRRDRAPRIGEGGMLSCSRWRAFPFCSWYPVSSG